MSAPVRKCHQVSGCIGERATASVMTALTRKRTRRSNVHAVRMRLELPIGAESAYRFAPSVTLSILRESGFAVRSDAGKRFLRLIKPKASVHEWAVEGRSLRGGATGR